MPLAIVLEDITVIDYARLDPHAVVRGDSLIIDAEISGSVEASGFVMDFGKVKPLIKSTIDRALDHRLLLATGDMDVQLCYQNGRAIVRYKDLAYDAPEMSIAELASDSVTSDAVSRAIEKLVMPRLPENVSRVSIVARHDTRYGKSTFAYTHGLPHHDGNCQRLLHGHRGTFEVRWDGRVDEDFSAWLAARFDGAHFANVRDVLADRVAYAAPQGAFSAQLPAGRIVAIKNEPSIEHVVRHAFDTLAEEKGLDPQRLAVRGNEGPRNGARYSGT